MDFLDIKTTEKKSYTVVYPTFKVKKSRDLMIRGSDFYAIWDDENKIWSTDEFRCFELIDRELYKVADEIKAKGEKVKVMTISDYSTKVLKDFNGFLNNSPDNFKQLNSSVAFANSDIKKTDYISIKLPYPLGTDISCEAYEELMSTLYEPEERMKLEWAIGCVLAGETKKVQKFVVLYGEGGTGKGTVINIIMKLFDGYYTTFDAKALAGSSNTFATDVFKNNPLVAIQHDGDLSRIEDNTKLNSIVSHEEMVMNEKYKSSYTADTNCMLFMGTNRPVKITDAKSGIIRRLIDVRPTGNLVDPTRYRKLFKQIDFELPNIALRCMQVFKEMGVDYYSDYRPIDMMLETDVFYNFVESCYFDFVNQDGVSLSAAYEMYKQYCNEALIDFKLPRHKFRDELKSYFKTFSDMTRIDGKQVRSYYKGFLTDKFKRKVNSAIFLSNSPEEPKFILSEQKSILDAELGSCSAQYANSEEKPTTKWKDVKTTLNDIDTSKVHYVKPPENFIVIDFDLKDDNGNKCMEKNIEAANSYPLTYAEASKSGGGLHLHYFYEGDASQLKSEVSPGIEIKTFLGNASLRRRLSVCNNEQIAHISSGLPLKEKAMINFDSVKNEKALRTMIIKNLQKEYHGATKPSVDFIYKILDDAYKSGMHYDVTDLRQAIYVFASKSTNNAEYCINQVTKMHFCSDDASPNVDTEGPIVFYDVEVFPNLFLVNYKFQGEGLGCIRMINPTPAEIDELLHQGYRFIGFNCRRYDNHIMYARMLGYSNEELFNLSQRIINGSRNAMFAEAYNLSYADILDFSSKKQSLKKFEIELGIHHKELGFKWDEPVPEEKWVEVAEYCDNDVFATEAVFNARQQDFIAREILADLSGLSINDSTQMHTAKIIFGNEKNPQKDFVYTDLSEMFPGYVFENGKSYYRGIEVGEGGRVYAEPGMYFNVALLDIASMHPHSAIALNIFGPYTKNFEDLVQLRLDIKHKEFDKARTMFNGKLEKYLNDPDKAESLAYALKIVINIVYGLTSASFDSKFRDPRNIDNIVAKRGALFMVDLEYEVKKRGFTVAHIKTDSIKIPNATPEIIQFVMDYGKKYGYTFEHEATYDRMCLVNDAVYIAHVKDGKHKGEWTATGAQFQHPYVFKKLFSGEPIEFNDLCETKAVTSALYLDMNENLAPTEHDYQFIGKVSSFCPILPGKGGGVLYREKDGKYSAATGTKGYRWLEAEVVKALGKEKDIDMSYFERLADEAKAAINKFGDYDIFVDESPLPWE